MIKVVINPGSGPVQRGSRDVSKANIEKFIEDLGVTGTYVFLRECPDGRHDYKVFAKDESHEVSMPAIPLENVRYVGSEGQNIWDFPRLYIDGSSWIWCYALNVFFNETEPNDEQQ